jgi:DEAD/DEAH box helicase domain-containing protein
VGVFLLQALAQDQLRTLLEMNNAFHIDIDVKIYDGDTPKEDRLWIRDNARLVSVCFCGYSIVLI